MGQIALRCMPTSLATAQLSQLIAPFSLHAGCRFAPSRKSAVTVRCHASETVYHQPYCSNLLIVD
jgi:hypothetical protein